MAGHIRRREHKLMTRQFLSWKPATSTTNSPKRRWRRKNRKQESGGGGNRTHRMNFTKTTWKQKRVDAERRVVELHSSAEPQLCVCSVCRWLTAHLQQTDLQRPECSSVKETIQNADYFKPPESLCAQFRRKRGLKEGWRSKLTAETWKRNTRQVHSQRNVCLKTPETSIIITVCLKINSLLYYSTCTNMPFFNSVEPNPTMQHVV